MLKLIRSVSQAVRESAGMTPTRWKCCLWRRNLEKPSGTGAASACLLFALSVSVLCLSVSSIAAAQFITVEELAAGLARPVSIVNAGDGSGRLFIVLQGGEVVVHDGTQVLPTPFLDVSSLVSCCGERGLLDIAFHPNYAGNDLFFISYTDTLGDSVIARYEVSADPNLADPGSGAILLTVVQPFTNHNGGQIQFGPDGYLYIGMGDGGAGGDPSNLAQDPGDLRGKLLRIDIDPGPAYAVPPDNPYVGVIGARAEIWALGLRNPWRFSFDRLTGDLFIADVGQGRREEVDFQKTGSPGGENYGWRLMEGSICFNPSVGCNTGSLVLPILEYDHSDGNCSITGGYRYRGTETPEAEGLYFYADFCAGRIWAAAERKNGNWKATEVLDTEFNITSFGEDEAGELYFAHLASSNGAIYRMVLRDALGSLQPSVAMPWLPLLLD
jgi:hypothetical protein